MSLIKLNNRAVKDVTQFGSISSLGSLTHISTATASSSASIEFSLGDYKEYQFYFVNIHPSSNKLFEFQVSTDGGSNYGVPITSTAFDDGHAENDSFTFLEYQVDSDLAQSTAFQTLIRQIGTDNDNSAVGILQIFNPSSSVYVKHFLSRFNTAVSYTIQQHIAGYINSSSPINSIKFQMSGGATIDTGEILLFGVN